MWYLRSQKTGKKTGHQLIFWTSLKPFGWALPAASQTATAPLSLQTLHFWYWHVCAGSHCCFSLISKSAPLCTVPLQENWCLLPLNCSDIYGQAPTPDSNIKLKYSHTLLLVLASLPLQMCCHNIGKWITELMQLKKNSFVPRYFPGRSDAPANSQHGPADSCFPSTTRGQEGAASMSQWVGTVWVHNTVREPARSCGQINLW